MIAIIKKKFHQIILQQERLGRKKRCLKVRWSFHYCHLVLVWQWTPESWRWQPNTSTQLNTHQGQKCKWCAIKKKKGSIYGTFLPPVYLMVSGFTCTSHSSKGLEVNCPLEIKLCVCSFLTSFAHNQPCMPNLTSTHTHTYTRVHLVLPHSAVSLHYLLREQGHKQEEEENHLHPQWLICSHAFCFCLICRW